mmetsp:Transcript_12532/g.21016  ORF Transcript_12532/g.21016 Transcript_12532/m.21016 type:complete len:181 (-) Transcript_12532:49-591(-)
MRSEMLLMFSFSNLNCVARKSDEIFAAMKALSEEGVPASASFGHAFEVCNVTFDGIEDCVYDQRSGLLSGLFRIIVDRKARALTEWKAPGYELLEVPIVIGIGLLFGTPMPVAGAYLYQDIGTNKTHIASSSGLTPSQDEQFTRKALEAAGVTILPLPPQIPLPRVLAIAICDVCNICFT